MFCKYHSIDNLGEKAVDFIREFDLDKGDWIVQEKVHGSNLSFTIKGGSIEVSKRSAILPFGNLYSFFRADYVYEKYESNLKDLYRQLNRLYNVDEVTVYGELFGGFYPHPDVEKVPNMKMVQKGVYYSPSNDFYAFDLMMNGTYYNLEETPAFFSYYNLFYAKTLFRGSFDECIKFSPEFDSKIPEWLGLPLLEKNMCEGIVIKPITAKFFQDGSRVILKHKNTQFLEKESTVKVAESLSERAVWLADELQSYVTNNRLENVLSKIGPVSIKDFSLVMGDFTRDVLEEYNKSYQLEFLSLSKEERHRLTQQLSKASAILIRRRLLSR